MKYSFVTQVLQTCANPKLSRAASLLGKAACQTKRNPLTHLISMIYESARKTATHLQSQRDKRFASSFFSFHNVFHNLDRARRCVSRPDFL
jgi:hypothetical protein